MSAVPTRLANTCEGCHREYFPHQKTQRYCCEKCRYNRYRKPVFDTAALAEAVKGWLKPVEDLDPMEPA